MTAAHGGVSLAALIALATSCSIVNDPGRHMGTPGHDGGTGAVDGGPLPDGTPPPPDGTPPPPDGGLPPAPPVAARDACAALVDLYCDAYDLCCEAPTMTDEQCRTNALMQCETSIQPYFVDARTGYDAALAGELIAQGRAITATCDPDVGHWFIYDLLTVLQGTVDRGMRCVSAAQLFIGDYVGLLSCSRSMMSVCRPMTGVEGWFCQGESSEGGPCNHLVHCEAGLFCTGNLLFAGVCTSQRAIGAPCEANEHCESLNCNPTSRTCQMADETIYCTSLFPAAMTDMAM